MAESRDSTIEILNAIGRGEFATVFRARDMNLKRFVAVKQLHPELRADPRQFQQFCEEAQFLAGLRHDNIVQVYGLDRDRGWIIMELMRGGLDAELARGPLAPDLVRGVPRQSLEGLKELHSQGKLHGAVRPSNLLIDDRGRVKLSDSSGVAPTGEVRKPRGVWKYMAPELCNTSFGPVGPGLDLYCLGLTALELLLGKKFDGLFRGAGGVGSGVEVGWMRWHGSAEERLEPVSKLVPSCPGDLAGVIDRLLVKEVSGRYGSAAEGLKDLENKPIPLFAVAAEPGPSEAQDGPRPPAQARPRPEAAATRGSKPAPGAGASPSRGLRPWTKAWFNAKFASPAAKVGLAVAAL